MLKLVYSYIKSWINVYQYSGILTVCISPTSVSAKTKVTRQSVSTWRAQRASSISVGGDIHKLGSYHKSSRTTDLRPPPSFIIYTLLLEAYVLAHPFLIASHFLFGVIRKCRCGNASAVWLNLSSRLNHYFTITAVTTYKDLLISFVCYKRRSKSKIFLLLFLYTGQITIVTNTVYYKITFNQCQLYQLYTTYTWKN